MPVRLMTSYTAMSEPEPAPDEDYSNDPWASEAVALARAVLDGSISPIEGCRRLWKPLHELFVDDNPAFGVINRVIGEVSTRPMAEDAHLWNPDVVAASDAELKMWLLTVVPQVHDACREIVRRFGEAG